MRALNWFTLALATLTLVATLAFVFQNHTGAFLRNNPRQSTEAADAEHKRIQELRDEEASINTKISKPEANIRSLWDVPPNTKIAIGALTISFFSLIGIIINSVFTAKTYKRNRRLEFLQRRDHLSQKISDLNDRNTEFHLISARYELVAVKNAVLPLRGEYAERNTALIASIKKQREGVENLITLWDQNIEKLHFIYSNLTSETGASVLETAIAIVQVASDGLKQMYNVYSSTLHILETTNELIETNLAETDEKIRQINIDFEKAIERVRTGQKSDKEELR